MRIGDPDSKAILPPHGLDLDPNCVLQCSGTVREFQSGSAMCSSVRSLHALRSSREITLNLHRGSKSNDSNAESPNAAYYSVLGRAYFMRMCREWICKIRGKMNLKFHQHTPWTGCVISIREKEGDKSLRLLFSNYSLLYCHNAF